MIDIDASMQETQGMLDIEQHWMLRGSASMQEYLDMNKVEYSNQNRRLEDSFSQCQAGQAGSYTNDVKLYMGLNILFPSGLAVLLGALSGYLLDSANEQLITIKNSEIVIKHPNNLLAQTATQIVNAVIQTANMDKTLIEAANKYKQYTSYSFTIQVSCIMGAFIWAGASLSNSGFHHADCIDSSTRVSALQWLLTAVPITFSGIESLIAPNGININSVLNRFQKN